MSPKLKEKSEWQKLKRIVVRRLAVKNLKFLDPKKLKAIRNAKGKSLLHVAAKNTFSEVSQYLLEVGLDVNLKDEKNGFTPFICALKRNDDESKKIIQLFLKSGLDISWKAMSGSQCKVLFDDQKISWKLCNILEFYEGGLQPAADNLLSKGWNLDNIAYLQNVLMTSAALNRTSSHRDLLQAVTQEDVLQIKLLLEPLADSKRITSWALSRAVKIRSPTSPLIIKLLLDKGAPTDGFPGDNRTPLEDALFHHNVDNCWVLLDHGAKFNNLSSFDRLCKDSMKSYSAYSCICLLLEFLGLWNGTVDNSNKCFTNIYWLGKYYWITYLVIKYVAIECFGTKQKVKSIIPSRYKYYREYYENCKKELKRMYKYKVDEKITALDIVLESTDRMIPFTRNERLIDKVRTFDFANKFPRHGKILQFKIKKAMEKRLQMDQSVCVLRKCLPLVGSYDPVLERIVHYMGVPNLLCLENNQDSRV